MQNRTKQLAENALLLGIAGVFLFLGLNVLPFFANIFLPIPFILLGLRRSGKEMLVISLAFALLGMLLSNIPGIIVAIGGVLIGWSMGYAYKKTNRAFPGVFAGSIVSVLMTLVGIYITLQIFNINPLDQINQAFQTVMNSDQFFGMVPAGYTLEQWKESMEMLRMTLVSMLPFFLVASGFIATALIHWLARMISKRLRVAIPAMPPIREWKIPRVLLFIYLIVMLLMFFNQSNLYEQTWGSTLISVFYSLQVLFFVQGISFISFAVHKYKNNPRFRGVMIGVFIFLLLATILSMGAILVIATLVGFIGLLDIGIHLRTKLESRK
ncbi:YybS family protein [Brevibacillus daliensis]|uniref:YybS family protein n=1 Tax=Brevibacillus daliensis TaxID=2892995 RepID=UPI001E55DB7C|nr:DUF2232 domain-containing protein [Brevibacillus daliensis]